MPWTPPVTYAAGTVLSSADIRTCQHDLSVYLDKLTTPDIDTKEWVLPGHIVRGHYSATQGRAHYVSGQFGGIQGANTFISSLQVKGTTGGQGVSIPGPTVSIDVRSPATLFASWWAQAYFPSDLAGASQELGKFYLRLGTTNFSSESRLREEVATSTVPTWERRYAPGGFITADLAVGNSTLQLVGLTTSEAAKIQIIRYGLSYELFYL